MTDLKKFMRPPLPVVGLLGALALGGCAGTHVGDAWQCPLAQGKVCASVAAADPAVNGTADPAKLATRTPLYRERSGAVLRPAGAVSNEPAPARPASDCGGGCDPFAWFAELFAADDGQTSTNDADVAVSPAAGITGDENDTASTRPQATAAAGRSAPAPAADDLRTAEIIGRVWIAPFADADGIYHEAGWVRVVIEPAGWRFQ